ncbi:YcjX family protein [Neptunomonas sp.]|uniref:YcjX family protein n=1 Tax=Neptunomonas sp. TaxID=1971898 RepID=UPI00260094BD|nr:YcjX family protein [Neptunomonas sp.]
MGLGSKLKNLIGEELLDDIQHQLKEVATQGLDRHLKIAVTGLSRSGKTVFITSLVHHLLEANQSRSLPFFEVASDQRIISVKNLNSSSDAPFPLQQSIQSLGQEPPSWPESTTGLSEVKLAIKYKPASRLKRLVNDTATLYLDIIDYPGEWLLDLPLLHLNFEQWCNKQQQLFTLEPRATLAKNWIAAQNTVDWCSPADEQLLSVLSEEYTKLLHLLRNDENALSMIQPGRCVLPGELASSPLLQLFPILQPPSLSSIPEGSMYQLLQQRYDAYREKIVKRFYREHFSRFDRQVVLVDCLKALNHGKPCFDDMKLALTDILQSFNYGPSGFLRRLFSPRIDKVLFASSKADHVTANQHHNLDKFLELIIQDAQRDIRFEGIDTRCMALASIRSTESAEAVLDGQTISCLKGINKTTNETMALFPGEVPTELPTEQDWNSSRFRFLDFAPKKLPQTDLKPAHHIRLDQALEYLTGDIF